MPQSRALGLIDAWVRVLAYPKFHIISQNVQSFLFLHLFFLSLTSQAASITPGWPLSAPPGGVDKMWRRRSSTEKDTPITCRSKKHFNFGVAADHLPNFVARCVQHCFGRIHLALSVGGCGALGPFVLGEREPEGLMG